MTIFKETIALLETLSPFLLRAIYSYFDGPTILLLMKLSPAVCAAYNTIDAINIYFARDVEPQNKLHILLNLLSDCYNIFSKEIRQDICSPNYTMINSLLYFLPPIPNNIQWLYRCILTVHNNITENELQKINGYAVVTFNNSTQVTIGNHKNGKLIGPGILLNKSTEYICANFKLPSYPFCDITYNSNDYTDWFCFSVFFIRISSPYIINFNDQTTDVGSDDIVYKGYHRYSRYSYCIIKNKIGIFEYNGFYGVIRYEGLFTRYQCEGIGTLSCYRKGDVDPILVSIYKGSWIIPDKCTFVSITQHDFPSDGIGEKLYYNVTGDNPIVFCKGIFAHGHLTSGLTRYTNDTQFDGSYKYNYNCNKKSGNGTYYFANGDYYESKWVNDVQICQGTYHCNVQQPNGFRKYIFDDGTSYEGEWFNGKKNGYGQYKYTDYRTPGYVMPKIIEISYNGNWADDMRWGFGTCVYSDGLVKQGYWFDDEWCGHAMMPNAINWKI